MDNLVILKLIFTLAVIICIWVATANSEKTFYARLENQEAKDYIKRTKSTSKKK